MSNVTRLSVNINADTAEFLHEAAKRENRSITEVIRRAVSVYKYVTYDEAGGIYVQKENGAMAKLLVL